MSFASVMDDVARAFEALGAAVLVGGMIWSATRSWLTWRATRRGAKSYESLRRTFGAALLLALEILVAADLIRTVAVAPTLENVLRPGHRGADPHVPQLLAPSGDRRHPAMA